LGINRVLGLLLVVPGFARAALAQDVAAPRADELRVVECWGEPGETHVRWRAALGYDAGPVAASAEVVVVGTASTGREAARWHGRDGGVVVCLRAADGTRLWDSFHERLPARVNDIPTSPIRSLPWIGGDGVYFVSNRGELVCVDPQGFRDGENDGPVDDEPARGAGDVDVKWSIDMPRDLGVFKVDASDVGAPLPSPVVWGQTVYCVTGNGAHFAGAPGAARQPHSPGAPSLIAVHKDSGRLQWSDSTPSPALRYGQWTAPAMSTVAGGRPAVVYAGGDAKLYALSPDDGTPIWARDIPASPYIGVGSADFPVTPPLVGGGRVYVGLGGDWESGERRGRSLCAFAEADGRLLWHFTHRDFRESSAAPVLVDNVLYLLSTSGRLFALDPGSGVLRWDLTLGESRESHAAPVAAGGLLYLSISNRVYVVAPTAAAGTLLGYYEFSGDVHDMPAVRDGTLYVAADGHLWAVQSWDQLP
jgi:outer membrane protein assembly factor BamB